jgi:Rrf2 family protein
MISQKARYAFKALIHLAGNPGETVSIEAIAAQHRIPRKFLEQILLELKHHGLIESRRGRTGGYSLSRSPDEISVGELLRIVDGPIAPLSCISRTAYRRCADCKDETNCGLRRLFSTAHAATLRVLEATSLRDALSSLSADSLISQASEGTLAPLAR